MYKQPVFIVGSPRAGTTLMQSILCKSEQYFPIPETHFFSKVVHGFPEHNLNEFQKKKMLRILKRKSKINIDEAELLPFSSKKEIFEFIIGRYNKNNKNTFLEKTPRHIFHYSEIMNHYPDARFICMIREPRNTVSSILQMRPEINKSVTRVAFLYNKIANRILTISKNRNVFIVRYEDLVNNTKETLYDVCNYLRLPYNSHLIEDVAAPPEIISSHEKWKDRNINFTEIKKNDPERWKNFISENSGDMIAFIAGSHALQFDYKITYNWICVCRGFLQDIRDNLSSKEIQNFFKLNKIK